MNLSSPRGPFLTLVSLMLLAGRAALAQNGFFQPFGVAVDAAGMVYVADTDNDVIEKIGPAGEAVLAGTIGATGSANGNGASARFGVPEGVAADAAGNVYVADTNNSTIRKITPAGLVSTFAGFPGAPGSADGTGSAARFRFPQGVTVDRAGNVYVADTSNHTIRKITPAGVATTLAGLAGSAGSANGAGSAARFNFPEGLAVDLFGNVFVADTGNDLIRKITPAGAVSTVAGSPGAFGSADGIGAAARFAGPAGIAVDLPGNLFVADSSLNTIRKIAPSGAVSTLAGSPGVQGNIDGPGAAASFSNPRGVAVDIFGTVYVADSSNDAIREITPIGMVTTLVTSLPSRPQANPDNVGVSGGITSSSISTIGTAGQPGAIQVTIGPAHALNSGAGWRLSGEATFRQSGTQEAGLSPGAYTLEFSNVAGDETPTQATVNIVGGKLLKITYAYGEAPPIPSPIVNPTQIINPPTTLPLTSDTMDFEWNRSASVAGYILTIGLNPGGAEFFASGLLGGSVTGVTAQGLPTDGNLMFARLYSLIGGRWVFKDYPYAAFAGPAGGVSVVGRFASPGNGGIFPSDTVRFQWTAGADASRYWLILGSTLHGYDLFSGPIVGGEVRSLSVSGLPVDGRAVYGQLWSQLKSGQWISVNAAFTAATVPGAGPYGGGGFINPVQGITLGGSSVNVTWSVGTLASKYLLLAGSSPGAYDFFLGPITGGNVLGMNVSGLPTDGRTIHFRLYSLVGGRWVYSDRFCTAYTGPAGDGGGGLSGTLTFPGNGSTLSSNIAAFAWSLGTATSHYILTLGSKPGGYDLFGSPYAAANVHGFTAGFLPVDGRAIYARLYSQTASGWVFSDATYTALTAGAGGPLPGGQISSPGNGSIFGAGPVEFDWIAGTQTANYIVTAGTTTGAYDLFASPLLQRDVIGTTIANLPTDGSVVHIRLYSLVAGAWTFNDTSYTSYTDPVQPRSTLGVLDGNLSALSAGRGLFAWSPGTDSTAYALFIGNSPGTAGVFASSTLGGGVVGLTVNGLPTDNRALYVRLLSLRGGQWTFSDSTYTASP